MRVDCKKDLYYYYKSLRERYDLHENLIVDTGVYSKYPYIFGSIFPITEEYKKKFSLLSERYVDHIVFIDQVFEGKSLPTQYCIEKYMVGNEIIFDMQDVFGGSREFKVYYEKYYRQYFYSILKEEEMKSTQSLLCKEEYFKVCLGKTALSKLFVCGMAILSDNLEKFHEIEVMLDYFNIYVQLLDDFKDLKEDIEKEQWNYYTLSCYKEMECKEEVFSGYFDKYAKEHIADMDVFLNKSLDIYGRYYNIVPQFKEVINSQLKVLNIIKKECITCI
ncbi:class 1 isoprenoid biosynthesis enzyme [Hathewaya histolytica]|uniref:class 1 isoprenoid biosynthesis enzyme n=1 Tax=Hathewaya histolytica TaxID=1498 RepID=UPI003B682024